MWATLENPLSRVYCVMMIIISIILTAVCVSYNDSRRGGGGCIQKKSPYRAFIKPPPRPCQTLKAGAKDKRANHRW